MSENYPLLGDVEAYGQRGSFPSLILANAQLASGPYFHTKGAVFEGGTRAPLIVKPPNVDAGRNKPRIVETFAQITDLYPTFADYAGAALVDPDVLVGDSAKPLLDGTADAIGANDSFGFAMFGERASSWSSPRRATAAPANTLYTISTPIPVRRGTWPPTSLKKSSVYHAYGNSMPPLIMSLRSISMRSTRPTTCLRR